MHYVTQVDSDDATCERTDARLTIWSTSLNPDQISALLQISPDNKAHAGQELRNQKTGRPRIQKLNLWSISSEGKVASKDLREHLNWLVGTIGPAQERLLQLQTLPDVRMNVVCVWWSAEGGGGPVLWPEQMRGLADLNLECAFDFQYYGEEDPGQ